MEESKTRDALYTAIGPALIAQAIRLFYDRAFEDPMIQHFFMKSDKAQLVEMQIDFASAMLGGPRRYRGKPLEAAHLPFNIRPPHFGRRQVIMREVLEELNLAPALRERWLSLEEDLRPLILKRTSRGQK